MGGIFGQSLPPIPEYTNAAKTLFRAREHIQSLRGKKPLQAIWFPMYDVLHTPLVNLTGSNACPTVTATPNAVKAAFTRESDLFAENGITYLDPILNLQDRKRAASARVVSA